MQLPQYSSLQSPTSRTFELWNQQSNVRGDALGPITQFKERQLYESSQRRYKNQVNYLSQSLLLWDLVFVAPISSYLRHTQ